jgi:hypothetical protein
MVISDKKSKKYIMKKKYSFVIYFMLLLQTAFAQNTPGKVERSLQKADNAINKGKTIVNVFQPYLLKARELYAQAKQMVKEVKATAKNTKNNAGNNNGNDVPVVNETNTNTGSYSNTGTTPADPAAGYPSSNAGTPAAPATGATPANDPAAQYGAYNNYTPEQYLPVANPASVNTDGTGNWGNQNNGLYGNCLDVLTGTVVSMGEAEDKPGSVDLMFFAPTDGQNTYVLMTPSFAKNNGTATYMTQHASDGVSKWKDVTESEVALTKLTIAQFDKIQTNTQITGAVKNAVNYSGWYTSVGNKLEGQVFAVKVEQDNRTVYALVAVEKHFGTSGSKGYLKIKVKSQGIDTNNDGMVDPAAYIR